MKGKTQMATGYSQLFNALHLIKPSFQGRISFEQYVRAMFWLSLISSIIACVISGISLVIVSPGDYNAAIHFSGVISLFLFILTIPFFICYISILVRRLHDVGYTGHLLWLFLACGFGGIIPIFLALGNTVGDNEYGSGNPNFQGDKFSNIKQSFKLIFKPKPRLSLTEATLGYILLTCLFYAAYLALYFIILIIVVLFVASVKISGDTKLDISTIFASSAGVVSLLIITAFIATFVFLYFRLIVRRLHDTGRSGHNLWWVLAFGIGIIVPIIKCLADTDDDNIYGEREKLSNLDSDIDISSPNHRNEAQSDRDECEE